MSNKNAIVSKSPKAAALRAMDRVIARKIDTINRCEAELKKGFLPNRVEIERELEGAKIARAALNEARYEITAEWTAYGI